MMYKFHITGYEATSKNSLYYSGSHPVDAIVYANTVAEAIDKVEGIYGSFISITHRKVYVEECVKE